MLLLPAAIAGPFAFAAHSEAETSSPQKGTAMRRMFLPSVAHTPALQRNTVFDSTAISLINQERINRGLPALAVSSLLTQAAVRHAMDLAAKNLTGHIGSDGSTYVVRISATGYLARAMAENVAYGYATPAAVVAAWMNSGGHRDNILWTEVTQIGFAYVRANLPTSQYTHYWVNTFGRPQ